MRTNIVIDDKLMQEALRATGLQTKREVVELGLRMLVRLGRQQEIRDLRGKLRLEQARPERLLSEQRVHALRFDQLEQLGSGTAWVSVGRR